MDPREAEKAKYEVCYKHEKYRLHGGRKVDTQRLLSSIPVIHGDTYLDVGCGRGEMLDFAESLGYYAQGVEQVSYLVDGKRVVKADAWDLPFPDKSFDVVGFFDVIEHLLPGDDKLACEEILRVAKRTILITTSNKPSFCPETKADLHINKRPYRKWNLLFKKWFSGAEVIWQPIRDSSIPREMIWKINLR